MKLFTLSAAVALGLAAFGTSQAQAIGCLSGGAAGAVAGHYAGHHAVAGAIAGCIAGHEIAKHRAAQERERQRAHNTDGQRSL